MAVVEDYFPFEESIAKSPPPAQWVIYQFFLIYPLQISATSKSKYAAYKQSKAS